ncbi:MAG: lysylphosphatidylglycerol synthase transmembrane domain-containing protein [Candidatus Promineifilaceae bacterium]|nr:lysylphosphatidylglycerol synthase transmembrane domain-containing protein [Candidatus Promineifilaceae bacterium]
MEQTSAAGGRSRRVILGLLISAACLASIFLFVPPTEIVDAALEARVDYLLLTALSLLFFLLVRAVRWRFMLQGGLAEQRSVEYGTVFHIQNVGYLLNNLMPLRLGDVARAILMGKTPEITTSLGLSTMVVERLLDLLLVATLFPLSLSGIGQVPAEVRAAARLAGVGAMIALGLLLLAANLPRPAQRLTVAIIDRLPLKDVQQWHERVSDLILGLQTLAGLTDGLILLFLSVLVWLPIILGYWTGMLAVGLNPDVIEASMVVTIAAFSVTAPSSPGQVGVFEAGVTFALGTILNFGEAGAAAFAFLYHITNYIVIAILGVLGVLRTGTTLTAVVRSARAFGRLPAD